VVLVIGIVAKVTAPADPSQLPQGLPDTGGTQQAITGDDNSQPANPSVQTPQPLPRTGDYYDPNRPGYQYQLPTESNIGRFDNLLKSPASRLQVDSTDQTGPASLTMALRYWGHYVNALADLQPDNRNSVILPGELLDFVQNNTDLHAILRFAGDVQMIKALVNSGIPVIVETGSESENNQPWTSFYELVTGYSDTWQSLRVLASYDLPGIYADIPYSDFNRAWQSLNYLYIVIYPTSLETRVYRLLGSNTNLDVNLNNAIQLAKNQTNTGGTSTIDQFFAWYNWGTSLSQLNNNDLAAKMYDKAFALLSQIPYQQRPLQVVSYEPYPFQVYFELRRYQDVIDLASQVIQINNNSEQAYYWRALAESAQGKTNDAINDMSRAVRSNPKFKLGFAWLARFRDGG
jgi:tetratricopeptide (TPR) repeat protein